MTGDLGVAFVSMHTCAQVYDLYKAVGTSHYIFLQYGRYNGILSRCQKFPTMYRVSVLVLLLRRDRGNFWRLG